MTISELIAQLQHIQTSHGDLEVLRGHELCQDWHDIFEAPRVNVVLLHPKRDRIVHISESKRYPKHTPVVKL